MKSKASIKILERTFLNENFKGVIRFPDKNNYRLSLVIKSNSIFLIKLNVYTNL